MKNSYLITSLTIALLSASIGLGFLLEGDAEEPVNNKKNGHQIEPPNQVGYPSLMSPHSNPTALLNSHLFVANTPSDTVDVINTKTGKIVKRISVGVDPVSICIRPDGKEVWVSNHVSDSVSVIDNNEDNPTYLEVIHTIQELDLETKTTNFDEPVGIAFANNKKAYVALSSENKIAVIDVRTRTVTKRLHINAQDPRAITVKNGKLYVIPFESNNKTQLSGGYKVDGNLVTFNAHEHSIANNNVLSIGHVTDIVKHPRVPDKDLFIFDTKTDRLIKTVSSLGTLLYGITVDSKNNVFISQTDARNDINGRSGTKKHTLKELENRAFLNQITSIKASLNDDDKNFIDLEPAPPLQPKQGEAFATPFAIKVTKDDKLVVASAASSDKIFTMDTESGRLLGSVNVGSVPRGISIEYSHDNKATKAWVLNAVANSVSLVDISSPESLKVTATITLEDPTHPIFKRGRIAFNAAHASTTETFSCASCHPDGHTDQLLWVLDTPVVTGGNQIMPRSTMPLRGLRDTAPFHWDGIPGDPYGGNNSAHTRTSVPPNSKIDDPVSMTRHVIDGSLKTTMKTVGDPTKNDEGKSGLLSKKERDDMAKFLLSISYPPAQKRAYTNVLSEKAEEGFELFHIKGDNDPSRQRPNICGNCHRMPFWVSTNTPGSGMDTPTWRGANDRFLILPQGRLNIIDFDFYRRIAERGIPERNMWQFSWGGRTRFNPVWEMVLEGSTGFSGSFGRQITVNKTTAKNELTHDLLNALEDSAKQSAIILEVQGVFTNGEKSLPVKLQYNQYVGESNYTELDGERRNIKREKLINLASEGKFVGTFTGKHGPNTDYDNPQPALWTLGPIHAQRGQQVFPIVHNNSKNMTINARHVKNGALIFVNGKRANGNLQFRSGENIEITLEDLPEPGIHFLQIQNKGGLFSNDFIFHVADNEQRAKEIRNSNNPNHLSRSLINAIREGNLKRTRTLLNEGADPNQRREDGGTPLSTAGFHGEIEIVELLLKRGAKISRPNTDGNTPLHVAAFLCRTEIVKLYLEKGASVITKNRRGESPIDVVSGTWNDGLQRFYQSISDGSNLGLDMEKIKSTRPQILKILRAHSNKENLQAQSK